MNKKDLIGGIAIAAFSGIFYYFYKKFSKASDQEWIAEYISEVEIVVKKADPNLPLPIETIACIMNLFNALVDFLYKADNQELEKKRQNSVKDKHRHMELVYETIRVLSKYEGHAKSYLESRLNISMRKVRVIISLTDNKLFTNCLKIYRKPYLTLPEVETGVLKKAYIKFVQLNFIRCQLSKKALGASSMNRQYTEGFLKYFLLNEFMLRDTIFNEFGIETKYFNQLLEEHNLDEDEGIIRIKKKFELNY